MYRRPPISTRTDTLFPYTTLFRSVHEFRSGLDRLFAVRSRPLPPTDPVGSVFEKLGGAEGVGKRDAQIIAIGVLPVLEHLIGRIAQVVVGFGESRIHHRQLVRSEERRVGKEGVRTGSSGWST